ncbi:hypothetical protein [Streptomyces sp. NPDC017260]|uniref:hypothetical protein n=1 Tax=unclassified Streptomyces TaxID=2593676 RepID=UPI0037AA9878
MSTPKFHYQPDDVEGTRFKVYTDAPGDDAGFLFQGIVYETADGGWAADWTGRSSNSIAMPGFKTAEYAAMTLYWYQPPVQSFGTRPAGRSGPYERYIQPSRPASRAMLAPDERKIDLSQCGCCVNNGCECEGLNRISQRFGTSQSYQVQPSLIPEYGVMISLMPMKDEGFLVDLNTRGASNGIGYLHKRDDGRYDVRAGHKSVGIAAKPETGMWACLQAHTGTRIYGRLIEGFEPHQETAAPVE